MNHFEIFDVFTDRPFGGNALAVVRGMENADTEVLQNIAREFNFSETTFVGPPSDPAHTARVRIFTPTAELPFAGHPTVGTALALANGSDQQQVLELGVGPIPVAVSGGTATFETRVPLETRPGPSEEVTAGLIGLTAASVSTHHHAPINASVGLEFLIAELRDADALAAAVPDTTAFRAAASERSIRMGLFVYSREGDRISARMFAPLGGIPEDPATGSACGALAALLGQIEDRSASFTIHQGVEMGRPSLINAQVDVAAGKAVAVRIGGRAVKVMEGTLAL